MKILITSGGTREKIDGVRVLTNISSGKLGANIADVFVGNGHDVHFVYVKDSEKPFLSDRCVMHEVTDVQSVYDVLEKLVPDMDVVIHPMAVSDFGFKPVHTKLKSNDPEAFIESLRERIYQTPKILSRIKDWNPYCFLISFKFEDNVSHEDLVRIARESMEKNKCDLVVANDKTEMVKNKEHIAYIINDKSETKVCGKELIAIELYRRVNGANYDE